jgi:hypothetical protein
MYDTSLALTDFDPELAKPCRTKNAARKITSN